MSRTTACSAALLLTALLAGGSCRNQPAPAPQPAVPAAVSAGTVVWMDVDPAVLPGGNEPDDGIALVQAFHSPELEVRGVSVVFGNSPLEKGFPNGQEIVARYGPEGLEVHRGAASRDELGTETDASRAMANALQREKLTILALGPVTNVATLVQNYPELTEQIEAIVAVAGRRPGQTFVLGEGGRPLMDMNFEYDSEGFQILLDSGIPIVLAPFEISSKVPLPEADIERFKEAPELADFFLGPLRDYVNWYDEHFQIRAIFPFDALAVAYLTSPDWIECEQLPTAIQMLPDDIHEGETKPYLLVSMELETPTQTTYCHTAAAPFKDDLVRRLLAMEPVR